MELKIVYPSPIESNNLSILVHIKLKSVHPIPHHGVRTRVKNGKMSN
jgi:hypothetical protein